MNELVRGFLDVLDVLRVHGGGLSEVSGPLRLHKFAWFGHYIVDPVVTLWGLPEAGRLWWNSTTEEFKYWAGTAIQTVGTGGGIGDMMKAVYDTDADNQVEAADYAATAGNADTVDGHHASSFIEGAGIAKITVGAIPPVAPVIGDLWVDTS